MTDYQVNVDIQEIGASRISVQRTTSSSSANDGTVGQPVMVAIRPEQIELWGSAPEGQSNIVQANLEAVQFLGDRYEYTVRLGTERHVLLSPPSQHLKAGEKIFLKLKPEGITLWARAN